jgi:hypothetical protein
MYPFDLSTFAEDQPGIGRILEWDGDIVVEADRFYTLDLRRLSAAPLELPDVKSIVDLASRGQDRPLALCRDDSGLFLLFRRRGRWQRRNFPANLCANPENCRLVVDPTEMVLVGGRGPEIVRLSPDATVAVKLETRPTLVPPSGRIWLGAPQHCHLDRGRLYIGFDYGEFGGGLWSVDIQSGHTEKIHHFTEFDTPVKGLANDRDGRLWAMEGLAHLGLAIGSLSFRSDDGWKLFRNSTKGQLVNWNLQPSDFEAFTFDDAGRLYVLSGATGLSRYDDGTWTRLTPDWPDPFHCSSVLITPTGTAVIGTRRAGIMLFDTVSGEVRRIALRPKAPG